MAMVDDPSDETTNNNGTVNADEGREIPSIVDAKEIRAEEISTVEDGASASDTDANDSNTNTSLRQQLGLHFGSLTNVINENLLIIRYATISTVLLLGVYGVANTPLFYRYTNVMDIPSRMFIKRKWIHGRIIGVVGNESTHPSVGRQMSSNNWSPLAPSKPTSKQSGIASLISTSLKVATGANQSNTSGSDKGATNTEIQQEQRPIVVLFRHSSPMERLLTQSSMERVLSFTKSPSRLLYSSTNPYRGLLPIELAGVVAPPPSPSSSTLSVPLLNQLIDQNAKVSLQLLAHRTTREKLASNQRDVPMDDDIKNSAICHFHYRQPKQWFTTTNAALEMTRKGQAWINSCGMVVPLSNSDEDDITSSENDTVITDFDPTVKQLQSDAKFISQLEDAEYTSWQSRVGMWSSDNNRGMRIEYVEEEESVKGGIWGWVKRGEWIRSKR